MFAYRATRPADLARCPEPVGELNDEFIRQAVTGVGRMVIAAWGAHGTLHGRAAHVTRMLTAAGIPAWCLGTTKRDQPVHPLYQPADAGLVPYQGPTALEGPPGNTARPAIRRPGRMRGYRSERALLPPCPDGRVPRCCRFGPASGMAVRPPSWRVLGCCPPLNWKATAGFCFRGFPASPAAGHRSWHRVSACP